MDMILKADLEKYCQKGERIYVTFLDGEDQLRIIGGQVVQLIGDAIIFKVKTSSDIDRTIVIYSHRIRKIEHPRKKQYV